MFFLISPFRSSAREIRLGSSKCQNPPPVPTFGEPFDLPQGREPDERLRSSRFTKGEALVLSALPLFRKEGRGEIFLVRLGNACSYFQLAPPFSGMKDCAEFMKWRASASPLWRIFLFCLPPCKNKRGRFCSGCTGPPIQYSPL